MNYHQGMPSGYNGYYPQQAPPGIPRQQMDLENSKQNKDLKFEFTKINGNRAILVKNTKFPQSVAVKCDTLAFSQGHLDSDRNILFFFTPDGRHHRVEITDFGKTVQSFNLTPARPSVKFFKNGERKFLIENLIEPDNFRLKSTNRLSWKLKPHKEGKNNYILKFNPHGTEHKIEMYLMERDKKIPLIGGNFSMAPDLDKVSPVGNSGISKTENKINNLADNKNVVNPNQQSNLYNNPMYPSPYYAQHYPQPPSGHQQQFQPYYGGQYANMYNTKK